MNNKKSFLSLVHIALALASATPALASPDWMYTPVPEAPVELCLPTPEEYSGNPLGKGIAIGCPGTHDPLATEPSFNGASPPTTEGTPTSSTLRSRKGCGSCETIEMICRDDSDFQGGFEGSAALCDIRACSIIIRQSDCDRLPWLSPGRIDPIDLILQIEQLPTPATMEEANAACAVYHEAFHSCQDKSWRTCAKERGAYSASASCYKRFAERAGCKPDTTPPVWQLPPETYSDHLCRDLHLAHCDHKAITAFFNCLCQDGLSCTECTARLEPAFRLCLPATLPQYSQCLEHWVDRVVLLKMALEENYC